MKLLARNLNRSDLLGAIVSGVCAIHCTVTPLFFAAKPVLEQVVSTEAHASPWWAALDYIFLALSLAAVWYSARHTSHRVLKWVFWLAWIGFAAGLFSEHWDLAYGKWLMYAGSATLIVAHIQNIRYCKRCEQDPYKP